MDEDSIKKKSQFAQEKGEIQEEDMLIEMADDTNLILGEDEMDMDNSLSKNNILAIKSQKNMSINMRNDNSQKNESPMRGPESDNKAFTS